MGAKRYNQRYARYVAPNWIAIPAKVTICIACVEFACTWTISVILRAVGFRVQSFEG